MTDHTEQKRQYAEDVSRYGFHETLGRWQVRYAKSDDWETMDTPAFINRGGPSWLKGWEYRRNPKYEKERMEEKEKDPRTRYKDPFGPRLSADYTQYRHDMVDALEDGELEVIRPEDSTMADWYSVHNIMDSALRARKYRRKPKTISGWVNVYQDDTIGIVIFPTKGEAKHKAGDGAIGTIYLDNVEIQE